MQTTVLRIKRLHVEALLPEYKTPLAAGMDLCAHLSEPRTIRPIWDGGDIPKMPTGIAIALEPGYEAQIRPRSGLAAKNGLTLPNSPGTIDADYRGELLVPLINLGPEPVEITPGMRIAQMIVNQIAHASTIEVHELDDTDRGAGGFGSTGT